MSIHSGGGKYIINDLFCSGFVHSARRRQLQVKQCIAEIPALRQPRLSAASGSIFLLVLDAGTRGALAAEQHNQRNTQPSAFYLCFQRGQGWRETWGLCTMWIFSCASQKNPEYLQLVFSVGFIRWRNVMLGRDFISSKRLINRMIMSVGSAVSESSRRQASKVTTVLLNAHLLLHTEVAHAASDTHTCRSRPSTLAITTPNFPALLNISQPTNTVTRHRHSY